MGFESQAFRPNGYTVESFITLNSECCGHHEPAAQSQFYDRISLSFMTDESWSDGLFSRFRPVRRRLPRPCDDERLYGGERDFVIRFEPHEVKGALCEAGAELYARVKRAERYLAKLDVCANDRRDQVQWLLRIARHGLQGAKSRPEDALKKMDIFEHEMKHLLKGHRDRFVRQTLRVCGVLGILSCLLFAAALYADRHFSEWTTIGPYIREFAYIDSLSSVKAFAYIYIFGIMGLAIGEAFTAIFYSRVPQYRGFFDNPRFRFAPWMRMVFVTNVWTMVAMMAIHGSLVLGVGDAHLGAVMEDPHHAIVFGVMTSIGFQKVLVKLMAETEKKA